LECGASSLPWYGDCCGPKRNKALTTWRRKDGGSSPRHFAANRDTRRAIEADSPATPLTLKEKSMCIIKRRNTLTISIALIASFLLSSMTLVAQEAKAPAAPTSDWSRLNTVGPGSRLAVKLKSGKTIEGKLSTVNDTSLTLSVKDTPLDVKREDVLSVHQLIRKSATKSTLIGLGVGAGAGAGIGLAGSNDDHFAKLDHAVTAGLAVLGAGAGALTGYLIGRSGRKRVLIYQAGRP
jgi:hypothetical protein